MLTTNCMVYILMLMIFVQYEAEVYTFKLTKVTTSNFPNIYTKQSTCTYFPYI